MRKKMPSTTARMITTTGPVLTMKSAKLRPAALPIMMLGGSPMRVAVPPMLEAMIWESRKGTGLTSRIWVMAMVIGPISSTVVTLSKRRRAPR